MNTNFFDRSKYKNSVLSLQTDDDKDSALRLLTFGNKHVDLCHNEYNEHFLNTVIQTAHKMILSRHIDNTIVGFALLELRPKKKIIDILLVCAVPNEDRIGQMVAHTIFNFAVRSNYKKFYVAPRTNGLRDTFVRYGFEHLRGIPGYDEVFVKKIELQKYTPTAKTLKASRSNFLVKRPCAHTIATERTHYK
jgi:hypothetical protein